LRREETEAAEQRTATIQFMLGIHPRASTPRLSQFQAHTSSLIAIFRAPQSVIEFGDLVFHEKNRKVGG